MLGLTTNPSASIPLIVAAYLLGSVASAVVVSRIMGLPDPRSGGSGNPGATNMLRLGGKKAGAFTLAGDTLKGLVPVLITAALGASPALLTAVAVAAFAGHLYPVFFGFTGGKGVATALGVLSGISWALGGAIVLTWLLVVVATRYSSLSALVSALCAPVFAYWLSGPVVAMGATVIAALLVWRHRGNIERLIAGTEDKIGGAKSSSDSGHSSDGR